MDFFAPTIIYTLIKNAIFNIMYKALDICAIFVDDFTFTWVIF